MAAVAVETPAVLAMESVPALPLAEAVPEAPACPPPLLGSARFDTGKLPEGYLPPDIDSHAVLPAVIVSADDDARDRTGAAHFVTAELPASYQPVPLEIDHA